MYVCSFAEWHLRVYYVWVPPPQELNYPDGSIGVLLNSFDQLQGC
jgi:hypothetical protein